MHEIIGFYVEAKILYEGGENIYFISVFVYVSSYSAFCTKSLNNTSHNSSNELKYYYLTFFVIKIIFNV